jgi:hypothetical protein
VTFDEERLAGRPRLRGRRQQAHSSPVYVEVAGRPAGSKADAEYFLAWIDRLERS